MGAVAYAMSLVACPSIAMVILAGLVMVAKPPTLLVAALQHLAAGIVLSAARAGVAKMVSKPTARRSRRRRKRKTSQPRRPGRERKKDLRTTYHDSSTRVEAHRSTPSTGRRGARAGHHRGGRGRRQHLRHHRASRRTIFLGGRRGAARSRRCFLDERRERKLDPPRAKSYGQKNITPKPPRSASSSASRSSCRSAPFARPTWTAATSASTTTRTRPRRPRPHASSRRRTPR